MTVALGGVCVDGGKFVVMNILHDQLNVLLQHLHCPHCSRALCILGLLKYPPTLVDAARFITPYWVHALTVRTRPTSSDFYLSSAESSFLTIFLLLAGRSTMSTVPSSTTKCEPQFLFQYHVFFMSFSFSDPIPSSILVPHYAYLDVVVRYLPYLPVKCLLNII